MPALEDAPDALLARRAADGDEVAFGVIVHRYASYLRAFAIRYAGSSMDADDAVQDALITAWDRLPELRDPAQLRSWLTTIVARKATDRHRARRPVDELDDARPDLAAGPLEHLELRDDLDALAGILDALPAELREVWVLKEVGGYAYEEIAERTGSTPSTVRGRLARARATVLRGMTERRDADAAPAAERRETA